jgi:5S rRNA maturation endonuclease (ribonuclease M5)
MPVRRDEDRLDDLEDALLRLREAAEGGTVLVEGPRDLAALGRLGIGGVHKTLHRGQPLDAVAEEMVAGPAPVILLVDWDRTGGRVVRRLQELLQARVAVDVDCRRRLAAACHSRTVEEVPAELQALRRAVHAPPRA